ncbi:TPA: type VI secretion system baseplate subunit TssG [Providencia alcalifaciens]
MALIPIMSKFNLFQQIRILLRKYRDNVATDAVILDKKLKITSTLSLGAPDGQVASLQQESLDEPIQVTAWHNGLTGAMGALPTIYSEWLIERHYLYSDGSAKTFLDIFDHRLYCLSYLAWQKTHLYALAESQPQLPFHQNILALTGLLDSPSPLAQYAELLLSPTRSMANLERWLSHRFDTAVQIISFKGHWYNVDAQECCQLGNSRQTLGNAPMLGQIRKEIHSHFEVNLGPMTFEALEGFISHEKISPYLWSSIRDYVGPALNFSVYLLINSTDMALRPLGQGTLGLDIFLGCHVDSLPYRVRLPSPTI